MTNETARLKSALEAYIPAERLLTDEPMSRHTTFRIGGPADIVLLAASADEIKEGAEEGIALHAAHSFLRITGEEKAEGVELQKVERFYFDENHRAVIDLVEGSNQVIPVDNVIFAVGQKPEGTAEMGLALTHGPYIAVDAELKTSESGVYAAGDVATGTRTVINAVAAGRKAAEQMDLFLGGSSRKDVGLTETR